MHDSDRKEFGIVIFGLASTFGRETGQAMLQGYWMGLEDLDLDDVKRGATRAMRESKFMPSVAELRELAGQILPADRAALAWEAFRKALWIHGPYASVDFDDKVINATVRNLGGWISIDDQIEQDGDKWVRKDFERVYQGFLRTGVSASQALSLGGIHEQNNLGNGYEPEAPFLIKTGLPAHRPGLVELSAPKGIIPASLIENTLKSASESEEE